MRPKMLEESPWQGIGASLGTPPIRAAGLNWRSPQPLATYRLAHEYTSTRRPLFGRSGVRREALRYIPGVAGMDWRDVLWSAVLPGAERLRGKEHDRKLAAGSRYQGRCARGPARYGEIAKLQDGTSGTLSANTFGQRLRMLRVFFERIIEWDWPDAPPRNPVIGGDIPPRPDPLPRFLDDRDAARLMAAARACPDPRDRLVIELLTRTGMRVGELADLEADAVVLIGAAHWLRIPLGKLRNDRYVPLHPELVTLLAAWTAVNLAHIRACCRLAADHRGPLNRYQIGRIVGRVGRSCGVSVHPHQLRHTLATQAINRGMRLEAIAALLGRTMEMTLIYASLTASSPTSTKPSARKTTPSTASSSSCPPTTRPPAWQNYAAKHTPACSATACAPAPFSSTAGWNPPAKPAATSRPPSSSGPPSSASATTPKNTASPNAPPSSTSSSSKSTRSTLDKNHPADSARLMASEPQHGARARIFQFCMDLGIERAFSRA